MHAHFPSLIAGASCDAWAEVGETYNAKIEYDMVVGVGCDAWTRVEETCDDEVDHDIVGGADSNMVENVGCDMSVVASCDAEK